MKIIESDEARTRRLGERGRVLSRPERWFGAIGRLADTWILLKTIAIPSSPMDVSPKSSAILLEPLVTFQLLKPLDSMDR